MLEKITIYSQADYYADLIQKIDKTKRGSVITLASMAFDQRDNTAQMVLLKLARAAKRGVTVLIMIDAYSFMFDEHFRPTGPSAPKPFGDNRKHEAPFSERATMLQRLAESGVTVAQTNRPHSNLHVPYAGRSHIKAAVIDDSWRVGGCNLADTNNLDVMAGSDNDPQTAGYINTILEKIAAAGSVRAALGDGDIVHPISQSSELLIDVGKPNQSIIYDRALTTIQNANESIAMTCQFFPSGKTARYLAAAVRRGVKPTVFYNGPSEKRLGGNIMNLYRMKEQCVRPAELFANELDSSHPFLHAKMIASEQEAIIGSHNYVSQGVILGTAEIAIHSTSNTFARAVAKKAWQLTKN